MRAVTLSCHQPLHTRSTPLPSPADKLSDVRRITAPIFMLADLFLPFSHLSHPSAWMQLREIPSFLRGAWGLRECHRKCGRAPTIHPREARPARRTSTRCSSLPQLRRGGENTVYFSANQNHPPGDAGCSFCNQKACPIARGSRTPPKCLHCSSRRPGTQVKNLYCEASLIFPLTFSIKLMMQFTIKYDDS